MRRARRDERTALATDDLHQAADRHRRRRRRTDPPRARAARRHRGRAARRCELHPLLNPAAYVDAEFDPDFGARAAVTAHDDGAWISLVLARSQTGRCRPIVAAVDPHLDVEVTGTDTDWTAQVVRDATPRREELPRGVGGEVQRRRVVRGPCRSRAGRLPLTVV